MGSLPLTTCGTTQYADVAFILACRRCFHVIVERSVDSRPPEKNFVPRKGIIRILSARNKHLFRTEQNFLPRKKNINLFSGRKISLDLRPFGTFSELSSMKRASDCKQQASKQHDKNPEVSERPYLLSKNPPFIVVYLSIVVHLSCSINALNNAQQNGSRSLTASPDGLGHRHRRAFCPHRHGGW